MKESGGSEFEVDAATLEAAAVRELVEAECERDAEDGRLVGVGRGE